MRVLFVSRDLRFNNGKKIYNFLIHSWLGIHFLEAFKLFIFSKILTLRAISNVNSGDANESANDRSY